MSLSTHIHTIDTHFQASHFDASYLLVENGRGAFIDCGTNHSVPHLLAALEQTGLQPDAVDWLILTHVHLDHAGGAGLLMRQLPNARLVVHPRGARHMIDPTKLWAGAMAVYGEAEMLRSYGELVPVPAERVMEATDGHEVDLAGRRLICLDTPGHARHHNAIHDVAARCVFTGDIFGVSYRHFDTDRGPFILPTASPVQFDPPTMHESIDRIVALKPEAVYVTHYGRLQGVERLANDLHEQIDAMVALALAVNAADPGEDRHQRLKAGFADYYLRRLKRHGWAGDMTEAEHLFAIDTELNAQGLGVWLDRQAR